LRRINRQELRNELTATRAQTLRLFDCLEPHQWAVPRVPTLNPPIWELGHVGWFQERWCVRQVEPYVKGRLIPGSILAQADYFYDSSAIANDVRWDLALPSAQGTRDYLQSVLAISLQRLDAAPDTDDGLYFFRLALFHEKMHIEAFVYSWQALGYDIKGLYEPLSVLGTEESTTMIACAGGQHKMGSSAQDGFVFDNEKWSHEVVLEPFAIASHTVSNKDYLSFVHDGGYVRSQFWDPKYFAALQESRRQLPRYWRQSHNANGNLASQIEQQVFSKWLPLNLAQPVMNISAFEAQAYCAWAGCQLPSEAQWEYAATVCPGMVWGNAVWEWTSTDFAPYAQFSADPYEDYSAPWFYSHRVVRGASFASPAGMANLKFRNFYRPQRDDFFVGFRVCKNSV
jgi:gamma-glutamyl hercynylcysteine S-oxide synthase